MRICHQSLRLVCCEQNDKWDAMHYPIWHVDDLKISHVDAAVNTEVIELINKEFGKEAPLTINRGKIHDYLGMTLDFTEEGKVKIKMLDYVANMLAEAPDEMDGINY